ncbi:phage minor capsid protein [Kitasatospora sp. CM 4170]|uniref:Phage minor capsid protein n=1 Tax=Kitasatospora aburaviensis TaxID=67265 RepID=A0ABW1ESA6_9ACTN|nr:phage minor capsid protein [Kitasatospora sp. CM 4170]WNM45613.1 phage minor capsid protein [Kitasatospora sp. CM 4170]
MPVSPADGEDLAREVGRIYQDAEAGLLERLARLLAEGIGLPNWAERKLRALGDLRAAVAQTTEALRRDADGAIRAAIGEAYRRGDRAAVADLMLPEGQRAAALRDLPNAHAVDRLADAAVDEQQPVYRRILRAVPDAYRQIVARVSGGVLLGTQTRRQAAQRALDQLAARGVPGFTDRAGRSWEMASYAEMAVRAATGRAAVQGHTDRLRAMGQRLVIVSDAPLECPLCRPWEGKVLTLDEHHPGPQTLTLPHATRDGETVTVHVAGSLAAARAAGLFHPNCRHSVSAFLPGATTRPQSLPHPGGATYEDTQQQRYYERQIRAWKRRQATAMDDDARRAAGARVRAYQARVRELTRDKGLRRKPQREQIHSAR